MEDLSKHTINGYLADSPIASLLDKLRALRRKRTKFNHYVYGITADSFTEFRKDCLSLFDEMVEYRSAQNSKSIKKDIFAGEVTVFSLLNGLSEEVKLINKLESRYNFPCADFSIKDSADDIIGWVEKNINTRVDDRRIEGKNSISCIVEDNFKKVIESRRYLLYRCLKNKIENIDSISGNIKERWYNSKTTGYKKFSFLDV